MAVKDIEKLAHDLEPFVDRHSLSAVLDALALLAELKSEYLAVNWQDAAAASAWGRAARAIERASVVVYRDEL